MEHDPLISVDGDMVNGAVPELFVEGQRQGGQFSQLEHHTADGNGIGFHSVPLLVQCCQLGFGFLKAAAQIGVSGAVGFFRRGVGGVFLDAQPQHPSDASQLLLQCLNVCVNEIRVRERPLSAAELVDGGVPVG